jgi:hypothetical protein
MPTCERGSRCAHWGTSKLLPMDARPILLALARSSHLFVWTLVTQVATANTLVLLEYERLTAPKNDSMFSQRSFPYILQCTRVKLHTLLCAHRSLTSNHSDTSRCTSCTSDHGMKTKDSIVKGETPKSPPARLAHAIPLTKNLFSRAYHAKLSREFFIAWVSKVVNLFEHVKSRQTASWVHRMSENLARQQ